MQRGSTCEADAHAEALAATPGAPAARDAVPTIAADATDGLPSETARREIPQDPLGGRPRRRRRRRCCRSSSTRRPSSSRRPASSCARGAARRDDARARAAAAAHAAHVQGQRADGRRDAPGRARAPDGVAARRSATRRVRRRPSSSRRWTTISTASRSCSTGCAQGETNVAAAVGRRQGRRAAGDACRSRAPERLRTPVVAARGASPSVVPLPQRPTARRRSAAARRAADAEVGAPARCCACAPTSSTGWSTKPAKSRSRARASKASCARSRPTCSSSPAA